MASGRGRWIEIPVPSGSKAIPAVAQIGGSATEPDKNALPGCHGKCAWVSSIRALRASLRTAPPDINAYRPYARPTALPESFSFSNTSPKASARVPLPTMRVYGLMAHSSPRTKLASRIAAVSSAVELGKPVNTPLLADSSNRPAQRQRTPRVSWRGKADFEIIRLTN